MCPESEAHIVEKKLRETKGVDKVLVARPGGPARILENGK
jgi:hypothetical protein